MSMHPSILSDLAAQKSRDMLAQAEQERRARQALAVSRASRRAERAQRQVRKARRLVLRPRSELSE